MELHITNTGHCSQQIFTRAALVERFDVTHERIGPLIMLAMESKSSPGKGIDVEVGLGVLTQVLCLEVGVDPTEVVRAYKPFMRAALLHIASNSAHWCFSVDDDTAPRAWLFGHGGDAGLTRRRLYKLLGNHERPANRYLVRRPSQAWSGSDDIGEKIAAGAEPMILTLDANAVAEKFSSSLAGPFFNWQA